MKALVPNLLESVGRFRAWRQQSQDRGLDGKGGWGGGLAGAAGDGGSGGAGGHLNDGGFFRP